ncbi:MAG: carboxylating nicotinate-nucleotide diphosphorylase [Eubacteriales bacterium]
MFDKIAVDELITKALKEDIGTGDITTDCTISPTSTSKARIVAKEDGIICGMDVAARVFQLVDEKIDFTRYVTDGASVVKGDIVAKVGGNSRSILTAERTALNLLQHLSGIATRTKQAVDAVSDTNAIICDTRKTTPGMRTIEKYAVKCGGGSNHRFNLSDGILIKDNHIKAAGGISEAVEAARKNAPHTLRIEVECSTLDEVSQAISAKADIIMLDNMAPADMKKAVKQIEGAALTEASGNMGDKSTEQLLEVAKTGVNYISIGALTHSVKCLDLSMQFI